MSLRERLEHFRPGFKKKEGNQARLELPFVPPDLPPRELRDYLLGQLNWEKDPVYDERGRGDYFANIPDALQTVVDQGTEVHVHVGTIRQHMTSAINYLRLAEQVPQSAGQLAVVNSLREGIIARAARLDIPLYENEIVAPDFVFYEHLLRQERSGTKSKFSEDISKRATPEEWQNAFLTYNQIEILPEKVREPFTQFIAVRAVARMAYVSIPGKHFAKKFGERGPNPKKLLIRQILMTQANMTQLQTGLAPEPESSKNKLGETTLIRTKRKNLIKLLDDTTAWLYDFYTWPISEDLIVNNPKHKAIAATTILEQLIVREAMLAGSIQTIAEFFQSPARR
jgi:hypothetical protein